MRKEFESIIKIQQMDREAIEHFTLSEILPMCTNDYAVKMYDVIYDDDNDMYYAHTGLGLVVFPRHLNETLEEIGYLLDDEDAGHYAFRPYSYTFGDRHGYSAKFYTVDVPEENEEKKECKYIDSCYEKDCELCPHYKYCTPKYEETDTDTIHRLKKACTYNRYTETDTYNKDVETDAYNTNYTTTCTGTNNPYQE